MVYALVVYLTHQAAYGAHAHTCVHCRSSKTLQYVAESVRVYVHLSSGQTLQYGSCESEAKPFMVTYGLAPYHGPISQPICHGYGSHLRTCLYRQSDDAVS